MQLQTRTTFGPSNMKQEITVEYSVRSPTLKLLPNIHEVIVHKSNLSQTQPLKYAKFQYKTDT